MTTEKRTNIREEVARLRDELTNGIKYDAKRNVYILVWTDRQLKSARQRARSLCKQLNIT